MYKIIKRILPAIFFVLILISLSFAASQSEEITITTYYPSPYGSYNELQLYPHTSTTVCDDTTKGTMYFDGTEIKICKGASGGWGGVSGYWSLSGNDRYTENLNSSKVDTVGVYGALHVFGNNDFDFPTTIYLHPDLNNTNKNVSRIMFTNGIDIFGGASGASIAATPDNNSQTRQLGMSFITSVDDNSNAVRMRIDTKGNVGIGKTPGGAYKLDVQGAANISGLINADYLDSNSAHILKNIQIDGVTATNGDIQANGKICLGGVCKSQWPGGTGGTRSPILQTEHQWVTVCGSAGLPYSDRELDAVARCSSGYALVGCSGFHDMLCGGTKPDGTAVVCGYYGAKPGQVSSLPLWSTVCEAQAHGFTDASGKNSCVTAIAICAKI